MKPHLWYKKGLWHCAFRVRGGRMWIEPLGRGLSPESAWACWNVLSGASLSADD